MTGSLVILGNGTAAGKDRYSSLHEKHLHALTGRLDWTKLWELLSLQGTDGRMPAFMHVLYAVFGMHIRSAYQLRLRANLLLCPLEAVQGVPGQAMIFATPLMTSRTRTGQEFGVFIT